MTDTTQPYVPANTQIHTPTTSNGKTGLTDAFTTHFAGDAPITQKATSFAKARPWTSAAFLGVAALALANTFGRRRA